MFQKMIESIRAKFGNTPEADALVAELQAEEAAQNKPQEATPDVVAVVDPMAGLVEGEGDYFPPAARFVDLRAQYDANYKAKKGW